MLWCCRCCYAYVDTGVVVMYGVVDVDTACVADSSRDVVVAVGVSSD